MKDNIMAAKLMSYDHSYQYSCHMYEHLGYQRTYELCNENTVGLQSGNVIKGSQYRLQEPMVISTHDDEMELILEDMRLENSVVCESDATELDPDEFELDGTINDEQLAKLVDPQ